MSHPARGPARSVGIDGKASRGPAADAWGSCIEAAVHGGGRVSHPARGPARSVGIDGKASRGPAADAWGSCIDAAVHGGGRVSHPARGPARSVGIDGKASRGQAADARGSCIEAAVHGGGRVKVALRIAAGLGLATWLALAAVPASAALDEPPMLAGPVKEGKLPPMAERLPATPLVVPFDGKAARAGQVRRRPAHADGQGPRHPHDGRVRLRAARRLRREARARARPARELRERRRPRSSLSPLRPGHRWSDGQPFTSEDFRYFWEDVANNKALSPLGLPNVLLVDGKRPRVELPRRAHRPLHLGQAESAVPPGARRAVATVHLPPGALPEAVPRPLHRRGQGEGAGHREAGAQLGRAAPQEGRAVPLRQPRPADARALGQPDRAAGRRASSSSATPTSTASTRRAGSCPTSTACSIGIADEKLIPAKTGAGEVDLQARDLRFDNYTFLKKNEKRNGYRRAALGHGEGLADRALPQPQHRGPGVAHADARRALPPRAVARRSTGTRSTR